MNPNTIAEDTAIAVKEYTCWSRMQAEAGQALQKIVERKERERIAGDGVFFWGVGNAPSTLIRPLAKLKYPVEAVFSIMKTRAKIVDTNPEATVVWRNYIDLNGISRPLPIQCLVTSRGNNIVSGAKKVHYALICKSDTALEIKKETRFDPTAFRNAGPDGAAVGASQVTALLTRVFPHDKDSEYMANMRASLTGSYWVRLTDPLMLNNAKVLAIDRGPEAGISAWNDFVQEIRSGIASKPGWKQQQSLLC